MDLRMDRYSACVTLRRASIMRMQGFTMYTCFLGLSLSLSLLSLSLLACQELCRAARHAFRMSKISCTKKCAVCLFMVRKEERYLENQENKI